VFLTTKAPFRNASREIIGVVGISRDITDRKREELATRFLAEATALLGSSLDYEATVAAVVRSTVPAMADGCCVHLVDEFGALRMIAAYHGDPAKVDVAWEVERKYPLWRKAPHAVAEVIETGRALLVSQVRDDALVGFARGNDHLAQLRGLGIRSLLCVPMIARNQILGAMTLMMTESERRCDSSEIPLAQEVARRAAIAIDHAQMFRVSQRATRMREDFLSIASHELRTPLTSMQICVERLLQQARRDRGFPSCATSMLGTVERGTRRLTELVSELLDITRLTGGSGGAKYEALDAHALVRDVVGRSREMLARAKCQVSVESEGANGGIWDRARLERVITNLLSNAAKYGACKPIEIRLQGSVDDVRIVVTDHGIGIPPEAQQRIFGRFERAVSERHYGGFGLGLWIAHEIVTAFGGRIQVESEPGKGATFIATLPRHPGRAAEADASLPPRAAPMVLADGPNRNGGPAGY
jgi:signal transduction histidine kinase